MNKGVLGERKLRASEGRDPFELDAGNTDVGKQINRYRMGFPFGKSFLILQHIFVKSEALWKRCTEHTAMEEKK